MRLSLNAKMIILAALLAFISGGLLLFYLQQLELQNKKKMELQPVVVTNGVLVANTIIDKNSIKVIQVPAMALPRGVYGRAEDVLGKAVKISLGEGEYLTSSVLVEGKFKAGLSSLIPEGKKAMSIVVNGVTGVAGLIAPGNRVDVIVSYDEKVTTMLQGIVVLAVDHQTLGTADGYQVAEDTTNVSERKTTITLAVDPEQAQLLALAQDFGIIRLCLNPEEIGDVKKIAVFNPAMLMTYNGNIQSPPVSGTALTGQDGR